MRVGFAVGSGVGSEGIGAGVSPLPCRLSRRLSEPRAPLRGRATDTPMLPMPMAECAFGAPCLVSFVNMGTLSRPFLVCADAPSLRSRPAHDAIFVRQFAREAGLVAEGSLPRKRG